MIYFKKVTKIIKEEIDIDEFLEQVCEARSFGNRISIYIDADDSGVYAGELEFKEGIDFLYQKGYDNQEENLAKLRVWLSEKELKY